jgi:hypothetical protein
VPLQVLLPLVQVLLMLQLLVQSLLQRRLLLWLLLRLLHGRLFVLAPSHLTIAKPQNAKRTGNPKQVMPPINATFWPQCLILQLFSCIQHKHPFMCFCQANRIQIVRV